MNYDESSVSYFTLGMWDALTRISKEEGLEALWGGTASSLMLVTNPVIHFVVYDKVKTIFNKTSAAGKQHLSSGEIFLIGMENLLQLLSSYLI